VAKRRQVLIACVVKRLFVCPHAINALCSVAEDAHMLSTRNGGLRFASVSCCSYACNDLC